MNSLVITMGDPAGCGSIILKKWLESYNPNINYKVIIIGSKSLFNNHLKYLEKYNIEFIDIPIKSEIKMGYPSKIGGKISFEYLKIAIDICKIKKALLLTLPISKESWSFANIKYKGHTEFLRDSFNADDVVMLFFGKHFKIGLLSTHIPLQEVINHVNLNAIKNKILIIREFFSKYFVIDPRIGILGINPHAGENGIIGNEENIIKRVISDLKDTNLVGPLVPDAFWMTKCDVYLAMYHDQGLAPFKIIHGFRGSNLTIGLPILRLSVSHGTAFDAIKYNLPINMEGFLYNIELIKTILKRKKHEMSKMQ